HMLRTGELVCTTRRGTRRVFDLPERRITPEYLRTRLSQDEILAALATRGVAAMGIATTGDLARYYNLSAERAQRGLELAGLRQVRVEGWASPAWVSEAGGDPGAVCDQPLLIGPFDNLIWDRQRTKRVFGFDYVFEAYKSVAKRAFGYYVLAVL